jgi:hypothetical protein
MAHFANINSDNIVTQVLVVSDNDAPRGHDFLSKDLGLGGTWIQTSYNTRGGEHSNGGTPLRKNYAGIGYTYDSGRDAFIPPKPYASWVLDEGTCLWNAPVAYPTDGKMYRWDEDTTNWIEVTSPTP